MADNEKMVLDAMKKAGKPIKAEEVAVATKLDQKEVAKIISNLKKQGKVTSPKNCFYIPA
jgi:DNA-binding IscR family transcriptional regulator